MNCDEFGQRMHQCLDGRRSLERDDELCLHARSCESCRAQFHTWCKIASIMPATRRRARTDLPRKNYRRAVPAIAGLAAAILCIVTMVRYGEDSIAPTVNSAHVDNDPTALAQAVGEVDPALWWQNVQNRDWVEQTMPTVRSVQEGVAPIGRSLMRAVTILTIGGREQTS